MKITAETREEFIEQLQSVLQQPDCTSVRNIIYFWKAEQPIPRVNSESKILYIGRSSRSLNDRYTGKKSLDIETTYFERFYRHVIKKYGALSLEVHRTDNPKRAEWEALKAYFDEHLEYPPLNRSIPNEPVINIAKD